MKENLKYFYMGVAEKSAMLSHARRTKVGAVIVKDNDILSFSWNGTPYGFDNNCEYETDEGLVTRPDVVHAEANSIIKSARLGKATEGATMFVTLNPCINCAIMIIQAGITTVYYQQDYRIRDGIDYLIKGGVKVEKLVDNVTNDN
jgi:dCMP deaminase